ncbi:hypothetical protein D9M68_695420 [compost metagenome]
MLGAVADQPLQGALGEDRHAWTVAVEEEHQHQAQHQLDDAAADLRAARQYPVAGLAHVGPEAGEEGRALSVDGMPGAHQPLTHQGDLRQPVRRRRQAFHLHVLHQLGGIAHMLGEVAHQPDQRQGHQHHPAGREEGCGGGFAAIEQVAQKAHQRPAGKRQHGGPEQRRPEGREHPEAGAEQGQQEDLHQ